MNGRYIRRAVHFVVAALLLIVMLTPGSLAQGPGFTPRDAVLGQTFSIQFDSPSINSGFHPADIVGANGLVAIPCANLGLLCTDPDSGDTDELAALSFGHDFNDDRLPPVQFSVSAGATGIAGTAVALEAGCSPTEAHSDVFETALDEKNSQDLDGDGTACSTNGGFGLGLTEGTSADEVDALAQDPCQEVDFDCNGELDAPIYFVLGVDSPSLELFNAAPNDIMVASHGTFAEVWADGITELGLQEGDAIDALCLDEDGDGIFGANDKLLFSLTPNSPSLAAQGAGPGTLLTAHPATGLNVVVQAKNLGLAADDDVDALTCGVFVNQIGVKSFLPSLGKEDPPQ